MASAVWGWLTFVLVFAAIIFGCIVFVWYYADPYETSPLTKVIAVLGLLCVLLSLAIVPLDIYNVSHTDDPTKNADGIKGLYYTSIMVLLVFSFVLIPFAYFYYEEYEPDQPRSAILCSAFKYTVFTVIIALALLIIGLQLSYGNNSDKDKHGYIQHILHGQEQGDMAVCFVAASMGLLGLFSWFIYSGLGLSIFPIALIRGKKSATAEGEDVTVRLATVKEKINALRLKGGGSRRKLKKKEEKELTALQREARLLSKKAQQVQKDKTSCWSKLARVCSPFQVLFGIIFVVVVLFLVVSLGIASGDRSKNSSGADGGYLLKKSTVFNPLDKLFVALASAFPIDYIVLGSVMLLFLVASLYGILRVGLRCFCIRLFKMKKRGTQPEGILLTCAILMFIFLVVLIQLGSFAPQYIFFGSQTYHDDGGKKKACALDAVMADTSESDQKCHITEIGKIVGRIVLNMKFFAYVFYFSTWIFLAAVVLSGFYYAFLTEKESAFDNLDSSSDEEFL
eukprot:TRINITY_DN4140_c3_g1_i1.p1 TRINITY_DN4140_c3_g1~~TRINITY_DN4140_c3_g1_i1.p1  ORF type:complete len:509 (-),score=102.92 TRINITY_DN4140_c3_g1_i1:254-1780(-)